MDAIGRYFAFARLCAFPVFFVLRQILFALISFPPCFLKFAVGQIAATYRKHREFDSDPV